jgi:hypothetical protein
MPRGKAKQQADSQTTEQAGAAPTKMDAVRQALEELGKKAKPPQIQTFIREHFGITMPPNHISSYKSSLLKKKRGRRRGRGRPAEGQPAAHPADGLTLRDLRAIKEMSDRIGAQRFRELVELLS